MGYKGISTLPPTSATIKRRYSKYKLIKTKLRLKKQNEQFNIHFIFYNPDVSLEDAINKYVSTFGVLSEVR